MKKIRAVLLVFSFYLLSFFHASAHVKWFVDEESIESVKWYTLTDKPVIIWSIVVFVMVLLGRYLNTIVKTPQWLLRFNQKHEHGIHRAAEILLGIFLIVTVDFFWDTIITPYVGPSSSARVVLSYLQIILGALFVSGLYTRIASGLLVLLCFVLGLWSGPVVFLENFLLLSLAVYFFLNTFKGSSLPNWISAHKYDLLRIGSGICLIVLAFTEKLAYPEFTLDFLGIYHWNFMQPMFPQFTDALFVLSVGMCELLFGILIFLGYLTRVTTLALAVFLVSSATAMFITVGDWEPGHVVIYAVALLFVFFGRGESIKKD